MRNAATRERQSIIAGRSSGSFLLRLLLSHCASLSLALFLSAVPGCSLYADGADAPQTATPIIPPADSLCLEIVVGSGIGPVAVSHADVFVFGAQGTCPLEYHTRFQGSGPCALPDIPGEKTVAAVVNFPYVFNTDAVRTLDNMETLSLDFLSDNPRYPVMTGVSEASEGDTVRIVVTPLMSGVLIESVTNDMDRYQRLEDPFAFLTSTNQSAELFRETGFCIRSPSSDSLKVSLPCDVGLFTQYPSTMLYCYPNDQPDSPSNPATVLNLCGSTAGRTREMAFKVPPMPRNTTLRCEISFDETSSSISWMASPKTRRLLSSGNTGP